jgi:YidC/Oxa1 family membrane protein insertase
VPAWLVEPGPLNLVTTWDTEYLPFSLGFDTLKGGMVVRTVQGPTAAAAREGWKAGERREGEVGEVYARDPMYTRVASGEGEVVYVWPDPVRDRSEVFIEKRYTRGAGFRIRLSVTVYNFGQADLTVQPKLTVYGWEQPGQSAGGMFSPPPNLLEGLCRAGEDMEREGASALVEKGPVNPAGEAVWAAVGNRYFVSALINRGLKEARCVLGAQANGVVEATLYRTNAGTVTGAGAMCYPEWYEAEEKLPRCAEMAAAVGLPLDRLFDPSEAGALAAGKVEGLSAGEAEAIRETVKAVWGGEGASSFAVEFYAGPKDLSRLRELNVGLDDSIDFWVLGFIAKPMLWVLRFFYSLVPVWAVAIVLLTVVVKLLLLYWTQKSYLQMQRMAQLKPKMDEIKEKFGKDKERLNTEVMNLYKREKVNPLGGCLPVLLQMPIWFALYRTIYSAVDLYQAPLGLWIDDLSQPDRFFVLPLLLGVSMFVQQKMTPTTMDSAQAKMMLWVMPIMFTAFMLFLPSGLNLYMFVNTLLSMVQQWYLRRQVAPVSPVAAGRGGKR